MTMKEQTVVQMQIDSKLDFSYDDDFFGNTAIDVDTVMRRMDHIHDSKFCEWVRSEENVQLIGVHLSRIASSYGIRRVATGLRWVTSSWSTPAVTRLLQAVTKNWKVETAAELVNYVTADWPLKPYTEEVIREFVKISSAPDAARFVQTVSEDWDLEAVSELVGLLSSRLVWESTYLQQFTLHYIIASKESQGSDISSSICRSAESHKAIAQVGANPTACDATRESFQKAVESYNHNAVVSPMFGVIEDKNDVKRRYSFPHGLPSSRRGSQVRHTAERRH